MTTFSIKSKDLKYVFDVTKLSIAKSSLTQRIETTFLQVIVSDGWLEATSVDGYRSNTVSVPIIDFQGDDASFLIKPFNIPAGKLDFDVSVTKDKISFACEDTEITKTLPSSDIEFYDVKKHYPEGDPIAQISFDHKYLLDATKHMSPTKGRCFVTLEIYGELEPAVLKSKGEGFSNSRLLLPVRLKRNN